MNQSRKDLAPDWLNAPDDEDWGRLLMKTEIQFVLPGKVETA